MKKSVLSIKQILLCAVCVLLVAAVCVALTTVAFAAEDIGTSGITINGLKISRSDTSNTAGWTYDASTNQIVGWAKSYKSGTGIFSSSAETTSTLTFSNTNDKSVSVSFKIGEIKQTQTGTFVKEPPSYSFNTESITDYNVVIGAGESKVFTINSGTTYVTSRTQEYTVTITEFSVRVGGAIYTAHLLAPMNGSYTATYTNASGVRITTEPIEEGQSKDIEYLGDYSIELKASPKNANQDDGYKLNCWINGDNEQVSTAETVTLTFDKDIKKDEYSIKPLFVRKDMEAVFQNNGVKYYYWQEAMQAAVNGSDKYVILLGNYTLPTELENNGRDDGDYAKVGTGGVIDYTIPTGVSLVVPYSEARSTGTNDILDTKGNYEGPLGITLKGQIGKTTAKNMPYVTLTVPANTHIIVSNGATLNVNAQQCADGNGSANAGRIQDNYGKMILSGTMDVYGTLYANGFIVDGSHESGKAYGTGSGRIVAHETAKVYTLLQLKDYRGGSATTYALGKNTMPLTIFYFDSIMVNMTYKAGATLSVNGYVIVTHSGQSASATLISGSGGSGLFRMQEGSEVVTDYQHDGDYFVVHATKGTVKMSTLKLSIGGTNIDTTNYPVSVSDHLQIFVDAGANLEADYSMKFLPGMNLTISKGATMTISNNSSSSSKVDNSTVYLYDKDDYQSGWSHSRFRQRLNADVVASPDSIIAPTGNAQINLYGTLQIDGTLMQSANYDTGLIANPGAKLLITKNPTQSGSVTELNGVDSDNGIVTVGGWTAIKGIMAGTDSTGYTVFSEKGTYLTTNNGKWYRYAIKFVDSETGKEITTAYTAKNTYTYAPEGYVITGCTVTNGVTVTYTDVDGNADINAAHPELGVEHLTLNMGTLNSTGTASDVTDITVTLTRKAYDYRVTWNTGNSADTNLPWAEYITGTAATYAYGDQLVRVKDYTVTNDDGTGVNAQAVPVYTPNAETGKDQTSIRVTGINKNITVNAAVEAYAYRVVWQVGGREVETQYLPANTTDVTKDLATDFSGAYSDRYVIDSAVVTEGLTAQLNGSSITVSGLNSGISGITVNLTLKHYLYTLTVQHNDQNGTIQTLLSDYIGGDFGTTVQLGATPNYTYDGYSVTSGNAAVAVTQTSVTISNVTEDTVVALNTSYFDYSVTIRENSATGTILKQAYITEDQANTPIIYSCPRGKKIDSVGTTTDATVSYDAGSVTVTNITASVDVIVNTSQYDYIVTIKDGSGSDEVRYITENSTTYTPSTKSIVTAYTITGSDAKINGSQSATNVQLGSVTVTGINADTTVNLTLQLYDYKITWSATYGSKVDYLLAGQDATFNTSPGYVVIDYSMMATGKPTNNISCTPPCETVTMTSINSDATVNINLAQYTSKVTFTDGENVLKTQYVKDDQDVYDSFDKDVGYQPEGENFITAYEITGGTATVTAPSGSADLKNGWSGMTLTSITDNPTVKLTLKPRTYTVTVTWSGDLAYEYVPAVYQWNGATMNYFIQSDAYWKSKDGGTTVTVTNVDEEDAANGAIKASIKYNKLTGFEKFSLGFTIDQQTFKDSGVLADKLMPGNSVSAQMKLFGTRPDGTQTNQVIGNVVLTLTPAG